MLPGEPALPPDLPADGGAGPGPRVQTHPVLRPGVLPQAQLREGGVEVPRVQVRPLCVVLASV